MHQINLSDSVFQDAQRRAVAAGYASVDEFVADILAQDLLSETPDLDHFFTPERLAEIDQANAQAEAGNVLILEQARAELAKMRAAWLRDHSIAK